MRVGPFIIARRYSYAMAPAGRPDTTLFVESGGQIFWWLQSFGPGGWLITGFTGAWAGFDDSHWFIENGIVCYDSAPMTDEGSGLKHVPLQAGWSATSLAALSATKLWVVATDGNSNQILCGTWDGTSYTWTQVAFTGPNDPQQISVSADGTLWVLDDVGVVWTLLSGSWQRRMLPDRLVSGWQNNVAGITEVATLSDSDGDIWVYFINNGTSYYIQYVGDDYMWQTSPTEFVTTDQKYIASSLHITYDLSNNTPIVYGISADGYLVVGGGGTDFWQPVWYTQPSTFTLAGGDVQLRACGDGTWFTYALMPNTEWQGQIMMATGTQVNPLNVAWDPIVLLGPQPPDFAALVDVPGYAGAGSGTADTTAVAAVDNVSNLWLISNVNAADQSGTLAQISGPGLPSNPGLTGGVLQAAGYLAQSPNTAMCFLAVDQTDTLWILRLTPHSDGTWSYGAWHPLHDDVIYVAIGPTGTTAYEIFNLDQNSTLNRLWTNAVVGSWNDQQLLGPTYATGTLPPYYVAQYATTLTVLNAAPSAPSMPIAGFQVSVSVAEPSLVHVAGTAYQLFPGTPTVLSTDNRGQLTIKCIALSLHTPQLTFTAPQLSLPFSVYPPQNAQNQLATLSGSDLQNATCQNYPPFPLNAPPTNPPLSNNLSSDDANNAATALNGTIGIRQGQAISGASVGPSGGATVVQVNGMALADAAALGDPFTDFWNDICEVVDDLFQAIKRALITVESVVVDVEQGVITAVLWFKEVSQATIQFVIKTIHDIEGALISAFEWIGSAIEDVINWIKEIFNWGNILAVHQYISAWVSGFLQNLVTAVADSGVATYLNGQIQSVTNTIENALTTVQNSLGSNANTTPRSYAPANSASPMGSDPLNPTIGGGTLQQNQVTSNYVNSQTTTYASNGGSASQVLGRAATLLSSTRLSSGMPIQNLVNQGNTISNNGNFQSGMSSLRPSSGSLFDTGLTDLLTLLKDFIAALSDLAQDFVTDLLGASGLVLQTAQTVLTGAIDIPVLTWLYKEITGDQLTLLDLGCLALAFPATVLWAILGGGDFSGFAQVPSSVPWPSVPGALSAMPPVSLPQGMADVLPFLSGVASFIAAFLDCASDVANSISPPSIPDAINMFLGVIDWMVDFVALVLGSPYSLFTQSSYNLADGFALGQWVMSLAVPVINAVFSFGAQLAMIGESQMQPYLLTPVGIGLVAYGVLVLVFTIIDEDTTSKILGSVGSLIGPIPTACKFLLPVSWTNPEELDATGVVLGAIDFVCDFASGGLAVASAMTSSEQEAEEVPALAPTLVVAHETALPPPLADQPLIVPNG